MHDIYSENHSTFSTKKNPENLNGSLDIVRWPGYRSVKNIPQSAQPLTRGKFCYSITV